MHKQRVMRAPLVAMLGLLACLVVPAAAQAHHIDLKASCVLANNVATVNYEVSFISFSGGPEDPTTKGTVKVDNVVKTQVPTAVISWNTEPGKLTGSTAAAADATHVVRAEFNWVVNGKTKKGDKSVTTNKCPKPAAPNMTIEKDGPSTRYVGDTAVFTIKVTNTGNTVLPNPVVTDNRCDTAVVKVTQQSQFDPGDVWEYTCSAKITAAMGDQLINTACAKVPGKEVCDDHKTDIPKPAIQLEKTGASFAYAGDTVTYQFAATNTGNVTLTNVQLTDDKCQSTLVRKAGETDTTFNKGDVWNYTCTAVVPAGVASVKNVAEVCAEYVPPKPPPAGVNPKEVCDEDDHEFPVRDIKIAIDKNAVQSTAVAGTPVDFTISVTNPAGSTPYVNYVLEDANCTPVRTGDTTDTTLDPGDTWTYTCKMATTVGQTMAENCAKATGTNADDKSATAEDCASVPLTTTPPENPPATPPSSTPETPSGGVLPESIASGLARLRGPSGCVKTAFRARVSGRSIASVAFYVDGKLVKRINQQRTSYTVKVKPSSYGFGRHRVIARVRFVEGSGTPARRLPLTFRRCAQGAVAPRFTG